MKRIGIFQLYDKYGYVDEFKYVLLDSILTVLDGLIIVINGNIEDDDLLRLKKYTKHIHIRINDEGFDAGAFRDVFLTYYQNDFWMNWDEVVLFNDTFYGSFSSWEMIFEQMEKESVDFWGLEKFTLKKESFVQSEYEYSTWIIPYFLVIKNRMLMSNKFTEFWQQVGCPRNKSEGIKVYEAKLTGYFSEAGFNYTTWLDVKGLYASDKGNAFRMNNAYDMLKYYAFPIVKVKIFSVINCMISEKILAYIKQNTSYDIRLIEEHLKRLNSSDRLSPYSPQKLQHFVESHKKIYIFGHGDYGKGMKEYFDKQHWKFQNFVVSEAKNNDEVSLKDLHPDKSDGIIVAVGLSSLDNVRAPIENLFKREHIMFPEL